MCENNLESFISKLMETECAICLEHLKTEEFVETSCGHFFHTKCINIWRKKSTSCPLCRNTTYELTYKYTYNGKEINNQNCWVSFINDLYKFFYKE
jgi:hypothetical protein